MNKKIIISISVVLIILLGCLILNSKIMNISSKSSSINKSETEAFICGGWTMTENFKPDSNPEAKTVFEKATKSFTDYNYKLIAVFGTQVVAGTNYLFLCERKSVEPNSEPENFIVCVYEDLENNAEITEKSKPLKINKDKSKSNNGWSYEQGEIYFNGNSDKQEILKSAVKSLDSNNDSDSK